MLGKSIRIESKEEKPTSGKTKKQKKTMTNNGVSIGFWNGFITYEAQPVDNQTEWVPISSTPDPGQDVRAENVPQIRSERSVIQEELVRQFDAERINRENNAPTPGRPINIEEINIVDGNARLEMTPRQRRNFTTSITQEQIRQARIDLQAEAVRYSEELEQRERNRTNNHLEHTVNVIDAQEPE